MFGKRTDRRDAASKPVVNTGFEPIAPHQNRCPAFRITAVYVVLSLLWIWLSDAALSLVGINLESVLLASSIKGTCFVLLSALLIFSLIRRGFEIEARSNDLIRAIADGTSDIVYVKDIAGRYLFVNGAAAALLGKPPSELLGKDDAALFDPVTGRALMETDRGVMNSGRLISTEETLTIAGMPRVYLSTKSPRRDANGTVIGLTGISRDITERKSIEDEIKAGEQRYHELADAIPQIVWSASPDGELTHLNAYSIAYMGIDENQLTGWAWEQVYHPDDLAETVSKWSEILLSGRPQEMQFRIRRADGEYRWHVSRQVPVRDASGNIVVWYGTCTDIEDLRRAKEAWRAEHTLLRTLIDAIPDVIFTKDTQGRFVISNKAHLEFIGSLRESDIAGKTVFDLFPPEEAARHHDDDIRVLEQGERIIDRETHVRNGQGEMTWRLVIKAPIRNQAGKIVGLVGVSKNNQPWKERERDLKDRERLLQVVTESARVGLVVVNDAYECVFANKAYGEILDLDPGEIVGCKIPDLVSGRWSVIEPWLKRALAGERVNFELPMPPLRNASKTRWIKTVYEPRLSDSGRPTVIAVVMDITERKEAEDRLTSERNRFERIVQTVPVVICSFRQRADGTTCFPFCSDRIDQIYGLTPQQLAEDAAPIFARMHPKDIDKVVRGIAESARTMTPWKSHFRVLSPVRGEIWIEGHSVPILEKDGSIVWHGYIADVTERFRTEEALRESERQLRDAQQIARLGSWGWEPSTGRVWWSDGVYDLFGLGRGTVQPSFEAFLSILHPEDQTIAVERVEYVLNGGDGFSNDLRIVRPDGRMEWIHSRARVTRDDNGQIIRVEGTDNDITERKRAEEMIRESENRYRQLVDVLPTAIFVNSGGKISFCNRAYATLVGATCVEDILGTNPLERIHPDYKQQVALRMERMIQSGEPAPPLEMPIVRLDGRVVLVHVVATPIEMAASPAFLVVFSDLTERERSMELLRSVLGSVNDAILTINEGGIVKSANPATERMFGYLPSEVIGENVRMLMPPPYRSEHDGYLDNYRRTGVAKVIGTGREVEGLRKNGSTFPLELTVTEFCLDGERNFTGVVRDITERKRLEAQFQQSQKMEAVGRLAGGVAHDFNNLLTIINGYADLMLIDIPSSDSRRDFIAAILDAGERAARLTQQLLAFSRRAIIEPRILDLNVLVEQSARLVRRLIGEDIVLTVVADHYLPKIKADPGQLEQIILNLVVNSRDAMPRGGKLTIETRTVTPDTPGFAAIPDFKPGHFACLMLSDTGCGMSNEVKARIFEPFFTTKEVGKGTGLGLAVVHGVVKQCGGYITLESTVGAGTTFKLLFPVADEVEAATDVEAVKLAGRGTETVLLVEDEDAVRTFARIALEAHGFHVLEAGRAKAALKIAEQHTGTIALVVTDVVMPEMGGRQLVEAIRITRPDLRVLYMSGYTDDGLVHHGVHEATDAFIQKPFTPLAFTRKIRSVIDGATSPSN